MKPKTKRAPIFELYESDDSSWHWRLRAANNEIVAHGEGYTTKHDCQRAVRAIKRLAAQAHTKTLKT